MCMYLPSAPLPCPYLHSCTFPVGFQHEQFGFFLCSRETADSFSSQWSRHTPRLDSTRRPAYPPITPSSALLRTPTLLQPSPAQRTAAMTPPQPQRHRRALRLAALLLLLLVDCAHSAVLLYGRAQEDAAASATTAATAAAPTSAQPVQVRINADGTASVITALGEAATASGQWPPSVISSISGRDSSCTMVLS